MTYMITLTKTVGIYGTDEQGNPWTTFQAINHGYTCAECGVPVESGWVRGRLGEEQLHVCSSHVVLAPTKVRKRPAARKIARIKSRKVIDERTVVYTCLSSTDDLIEYETTFIDGVYAGCKCPARVWWCYHAQQLQAREDALAAEKPKPVPVHIPPAAVWHRPYEREVMPLNGNRPFALLK